MGLDSFLLLAQTNVLDVPARNKKLTQNMIPVVAGIITSKVPEKTNNNSCFTSKEFFIVLTE